MIGARDEYVKLATLCAHYGGVSRMWISRRIKHDGFPAPIRFGTTSTRLWRLDEVKKWDRNQEALGRAFEKKAVR